MCPTQPRCKHDCIWLSLQSLNEIGSERCSRSRNPWHTGLARLCGASRLMWCATPWSTLSQLINTRPFAFCLWKYTNWKNIPTCAQGEIHLTWPALTNHSGVWRWQHLQIALRLAVLTPRHISQLSPGAHKQPPNQQILPESVVKHTGNKADTRPCSGPPLQCAIHLLPHVDGEVAVMSNAT